MKLKKKTEIHRWLLVETPGLNEPVFESQKELVEMAINTKGTIWHNRKGFHSVRTSFSHYLTGERLPPETFKKDLLIIIKEQVIKKKIDETSQKNILDSFDKKWESFIAELQLLNKKRKQDVVNFPDITADHLDKVLKICTSMGGRMTWETFHEILAGVQKAA